MSEEQQERLKQIRERLLYGTPKWQLREDSQYLLSLLDSQSDTIIIPLIPITAQKAATAMRDKCVEKVKAMRDGCSLVSDDPFVSGVRATYNSVIAELSSLTLDQVKPEKHER